MVSDQKSLTVSTSRVWENSKQSRTSAWHHWTPMLVVSMKLQCQFTIPEEGCVSIFLPDAITRVCLTWFDYKFYDSSEIVQRGRPMPFAAVGTHNALQTYLEYPRDPQRLRLLQGEIRARCQVSARSLFKS